MKKVTEELFTRTVIPGMVALAVQSWGALRVKGQVIQIVFV